MALTPIIMKSLERIVIQQLTKFVEDKLNIFQFAYKRNRSTEDAVVTLIHFILKHLDKPKCKAGALFFDFISAFNTIQPELLLAKMIQMEINPHLVHWYHSFFTNRNQIVKVNQTHSSFIVTNSGAPQGCPFSPLLFTLYTDDCKTECPNTFILKFSDDTTLLSLLSPEDDPCVHQHATDRLVKWYSPPVTVHNAEIEQVSSYKYLGIYVDATLSWSVHVDFICCKVQQRIYFLRRLRSFGANKHILLLFL